MKTTKILMLIYCGLLLVSCKNPKETIPESTKINFGTTNSQLSSGFLKRVDSFPSKYVRPRTVDVWLPSDYSEADTYAVVYMHDGQMLFDSTATWNGQEWKVDEIFGALLDEKKIKKTIVVAIWNHSDIRWADYYPKKPFDLIPQKFRDSLITAGKKQLGDAYIEFQSDAYLKFIVKELKPVIDANFATSKKREDTVIAGSSMGGLISMYGFCEYPEVFGGAACLSTHWPGMMPFENNPIPESFFEYMNQNLPPSTTHKIYFDYGTETLDSSYLPYQERVNEVLKGRGYDETTFRNLKFEGHDHSENSWSQRFQIPIQFLLRNE